MTDLQVLIRALFEAFGQLDLARQRVTELTAERDHLLERLSATLSPGEDGADDATP